jgi:diguanylate cyclase
MKIFSLIFLFNFSFFSLLAQGDFKYGININDKTKVFVTTAQMSSEEVLHAIHKNKLKQIKNKVSHGLTTEYFWVIFNISDINNENQSHLIELNSPHIDTAALYLIKEGKTILIAEIGDRIPFTKRPIIHPKLLFPLPVGDSNGEYLLKIDKQGGSANFPLYLWKKDSFEYHNTKEMLLWYAFMGSFLFFFILSAIASKIINNQLFKYYSAFVFIVLSYNFITAGFSFAFIYPNNIWLNDVLRFLILPLFGFSYVSFSRHYFDVNRAFPLLDIYANLINAVFIILTFLGVIFTSTIQKYAILVVSILYINLISAVIWSLVIIFWVWARLKYRSILFLCAFSGNIFVLIFNVLTEFGLVEKTLFRFNPIFIANFQEVAVMSVGMIFYLSRIQKERKNLKAEKDQMTESEIQLREELKQFMSQKKLSDVFLTHKEEALSKYSYLLKDKTVINFSEVIFIESMDHSLTYHFKDRKVTERKTIKEFLEKVTNENFIQVHKSFIVNKEFIVTIESNKISMTNGIIIPFSRTFKARFSK